jgi:hypothetical protein
MRTANNSTTTNTTIENTITHKGNIGLPENMIFVPQTQGKTIAWLDQSDMSVGVIGDRFERSTSDLDEQRKLDDKRGINDGR